MKKYQGSSEVDPRVIEEVDYVWQGQSFGSLVGSNTKFDWIIASHVIEHTPDFVGFLQQCESILAHDGALALVVPDKRFCFDRYRPLAGLASILDAHSEKRLRHTPGVAADYYLNVVRRGGTIAWDAAHRGACVSLHDVSDALQGIQTLQQPGLYLDLHAWCFTPSWFRVIMHDLHVLGLIRLRESFFNETQGHEFFMTLRRDGPGPNVSRLDLLGRSLAELAVGAA